MGNFKLTGLAAGTVNGDSVRYEQVVGTYLPLAGGSMTGAINEALSTVAATATTTPLWDATYGNVQTWTGTPAITALPNAPQAGASREVYPAAGTTITAGANLLVAGLASGQTYTFAANDKLVIQALSATQFNCNIYKKDGSAFSTNSKIQSIAASVASNALTVSINPTTLDFRSTTLTDGTPVTRTLTSAASLVVPSGATLGTVNATSARLAIIAIDNAGTLEAAIVNLAGGNNLDETTLISTTAISTSADSSNVIYSTTARTNVAFRVVGFIDISEATAGTWATAPTLVQGTGGQALAALSSLGYGQTWQSVSGSRAVGTTYYNTTGRPIAANITATMSSGTQSLVMTINGEAIPGPTSINASSQPASILVIIPAGASYVLSASAGTATIGTWKELR